MFSGYEEYTIWGRSVFRLSNRGQMLKTLKISIAGLELKGGAAFPSFRYELFARHEKVHVLYLNNCSSFFVNICPTKSIFGS